MDFLEKLLIIDYSSWRDAKNAAVFIGPLEDIVFKIKFPATYLTEFLDLLESELLPREFGFCI
ncbi:MAG: hypothetical protein C0623_00295 [Desulfuromonas sp.]|nr:MAG: hypothetical protein C0623_00295 [Desulfuromonas sp.]